MKRFWLSVAAVAVLSACGDNPFAVVEEVPETDTGTGSGTEEPATEPTIVVPEAILADIESVSYDPDSGILEVTGVGLDDTPFTTEYTRNASLDQGNYQAFTSQDNSLSRHNTAFAQERDGVFAVTTASGQFATLIAGATFGRTGAYTAPVVGPDTGIVAYAGQYIGLLNVPGDQGDLLPVAPGTPDELRPVQVAHVNGLIFINADFANNEIEGTIINRTSAINSDPINTPTTTTTYDLAPLIVQRGTINDDGTFEGGIGFEAEDNVGQYAGVFGGEAASAVAGAVNMNNHVSTTTGSDLTIDGAEEFGIFVLPTCNGPDADPVCP